MLLEMQAIFNNNKEINNCNFLMNKDLSECLVMFVALMVNISSN